MKPLEDILSAVDAICEIRGRRDRTIEAIRYDSRQVHPGDLFVAINGRDDHGVEFVPAAIEAGANVVVTDASEHMPVAHLEANDVTLVVVKDARLAMAQMANALFDYPATRLKLYAVTGTNGKTTTTYVLRQLLECVGEKVGVIGTLGKMLGQIVPTGYTTPEAPELMEILDEMAGAGLDAVAMEVSSHALALHRVAGLRFDGAIFTNLTQDHLDFHLTMQDYLDAKKILFDRLDRDRVAVVNVDDLHAESMVHDSHARIYRYGTVGPADARTTGIQLGPRDSRWELTLSDRLGGGRMALESALLGAFNVSNITAAFTLALALGYDRDTLVTAVKKLQPVPGRMESIPLANGATAVVDYAHTPDALENVLNALREISQMHGTITAVFGCGGDRDRSKRPLMGSIASKLADRVILTSDNPRSEPPDAIISEIRQGIEDLSSVESITDRAMAIHRALDESEAGDLVLIAGKGHEDYQIIGSERRHFNDSETVREWNAHSGEKRLNGVAAA